MTELRPIEDASSPEVRALAQALRDLFKGLRVSARRYGIRRSYDSGTVSRYLAGRRLPPWKFVLDLVHDVAEERGALPTEETVAMLRALHAAAVNSGNGATHKVQLLERQLAEADREARGAATRERVLEEALQDREHRIRDLQLRERELRAGAASFGAVGGGPSLDEYARLREEIQDLTAELSRVRDLHRQAEERCERLERRLAEAEGLAGRAGDAAVLPGVEAGVGAVALGDVHVINNYGSWEGGGWEADEEYASSVSVRLFEGEEHVGNGLLLAPDTVITVGRLWGEGEQADWGPVEAGLGERRVRVDPEAVHHCPRLSEIGLRDGAVSVTVLRPVEPLPAPGRAPAFERRLAPGSRLLVSAHGKQGPYSCLVDVKGRSGDWLRLAGELTYGLVGAPAFSRNGALAGLLMPAAGDRERGILLPVATLDALVGDLLGG
ncbi:hypothetical protein ACF07V_03875 [Streptomyces sp. NPDC015661]|uniref:hypothetical protein n=1 Tax=Streptomyces sp. NPDC015661 TaxID=3364961 RepID=UPI0036FF55B4